MKIRLQIWIRLTYQTTKLIPILILGLIFDELPIVTPIGQVDNFLINNFVPSSGRVDNSQVNNSQFNISQLPSIPNVITNNNSITHSLKGVLFFCQFPSLGHTAADDIDICCQENCLHNWESFETCHKIDETISKYSDDNTPLFGYCFPISVGEGTSMETALAYCTLKITEKKHNYVNPT